MCAMFQHFSFVAAIFFKQRQKIIQVSVSETSSLRSSRGKIFLLILLIENNFIDNIVRKFNSLFLQGNENDPKFFYLSVCEPLKLEKGRCEGDGVCMVTNNSTKSYKSLGRYEHRSMSFFREDEMLILQYCNKECKGKCSVKRLKSNLRKKKKKIKLVMWAISQFSHLTTSIFPAVSPWTHLQLSLLFSFFSLTFKETNF